jgi:hypothetical protein
MVCLSRIRCCAVGFFLAMCVAATARAGVMLSPTAVLGTDLGTFDPAVVPLENMINQSSLDKPFTSGVTDFDTYFNTGDPPFGQGGPGNWQSDFSFNLPLMGFVDFDLGAVHMIERMAIWNRSLENIDILVSETQGGPFTSAGSFTLTNHLNFPFSYVPEILELDDAFQARYLRIDINSTYKFDVSDTFAYAIIGEIVLDAVTPGDGPSADFDDDGDVDGADFLVWQRDDATPEGLAEWKANFPTNAVAAINSVPEPTSLALLAICGFGGMAFRRRR